MLTAPSDVIGKSISQVYLQKMTQMHNNGQAVFSFYIKTLKNLAIISLPIFIIIVVSAEPLFSFVFGEQWKMAGRLAVFLVPLTWIRFISSPLSVIIDAFERQHILLIFNALLIVTTLGSFGYAYIKKLSIFDSILLFSILTSILYSWLLYQSWLTVKNLKARTWAY